MTHGDFDDSDGLYKKESYLFISDFYHNIMRIILISSNVLLQIFLSMVMPMYIKNGQNIVLFRSLGELFVWTSGVTFTLLSNSSIISNKYHQIQGIIDMTVSKTFVFLRCPLLITTIYWEWKCSITHGVVYVYCFGFTTFFEAELQE